MFNIDTDRLIEDLLSPRLRTADILRLLKSIMQPIKSMVVWINSFRTATTAKLSYNAQVCSLERLLNDRFDQANREIYITDAVSLFPLIAYPYPDVDHRIITTTASDFLNHPLVTRQASILGENLHRFIINISDSNDIRNREIEIIALTNQYKFSGKSFILLYY